MILMITRVVALFDAMKVREIIRFQNCCTRVIVEESYGLIFTREALYSTVDGFFISTLLDSSADVCVRHIADSYSSMQGSDHRLVYVEINF